VQQKLTASPQQQQQQMKTQISSLERSLLLGAVSDLQTLRKGQLPDGWGHGSGYFAKQEAIEDAERQIVRLDSGRWLDHPLSASDRVMAGRAIERMERRGLVERATFSERTTHLIITPQGIRLAEELQEAATAHA
jgi:hypothetical protein